MKGDEFHRTELHRDADAANAKAAEWKVACAALPGGRVMSPLLCMLAAVVIGCAIAAVVLSAWGNGEGYRSGHADDSQYSVRTRARSAPRGRTATDAAAAPRGPVGR